MGDTHIHIGSHPICQEPFYVEINRKLDKIMATQLEFAEKVSALAAELEDTKKIVAKVGEETDALLASIVELKEALVKGDEVKPELQAAFNLVLEAAQSVKVAASQVDDKVAD